MRPVSSATISRRSRSGRYWRTWRRPVAVAPRRAGAPVDGADVVPAHVLAQAVELGAATWPARRDQAFDHAQPGELFRQQLARRERGLNAYRAGRRVPRWRAPSPSGPNERIGHADRDAIAAAGREQLLGNVRRSPAGIRTVIVGGVSPADGGHASRMRARTERGPAVGDDQLGGARLTQPARRRNAAPDRQLPRTRGEQHVGEHGQQRARRPRCPAAAPGDDETSTAAVSASAMSPARPVTAMGAGLASARHGDGRQHRVEHAVGRHPFEFGFGSQRHPVPKAGRASAFTSSGVQ